MDMSTPVICSDMLQVTVVGTHPLIQNLIPETDHESKLVSIPGRAGVSDLARRPTMRIDTGSMGFLHVCFGTSKRWRVLSSV